MRVIWRDVKNPRIDLREGEIVVIAPRGTNIDALIERKREWIERNMERVKTLIDKAKKELEINGVRILDNYRNVVHNCKNVGIFGNSIHVCKRRRNLLKEKLRAMLREDLEKKVANYSSILNIEPERIFIREQKTKWGSCSSSMNLSFNMGLIFLPSEFREYVVAHEMVHLLYPNHGTKFREVLASLGVKIPSKDDELFYWYYARMCKKFLNLESHHE